ncbi:MAG: DUF2141 domain-containing protein [Kiritimatiellales bacterium]|nr:DUF2141 domain-containing protein [Kiritimatiellales bacterium]
MKKIILTSLILIGTVCARAETLTVTITTEGPREGSISILLFSGRSGFPHKSDMAILKVRIPVPVAGPIEYKFTDLPYGRYALSAHHDVNDNQSFDKILWFGPSREPVGFSNISAKKWLATEFQDADFIFGRDKKKITVKLM